MAWILSSDPLETVFPEVDDLESGISPVAVGGDLSVVRLEKAYRAGIFPWFRWGEWICWWSPDPRTVLFPEKLKVSRSLKKSIRNRGYTVTLDKDFEATILNCADTPRKDQSIADSWITQEMIDAYCEFHKHGFAHSVETWCDGELVGGLYGVSLGRMFFGESMFFHKTDASKVAFCYLVDQLKEANYSIIDCQMPTNLLYSLGAENIDRVDFVKIVKEAVDQEPTVDIWSHNH